MEQSAPSKFWFLPLLSGILFIIAGIWIFRTPESSYVALSILFAAAFFVSGIFEIFRALGNTQISKIPLTKNAAANKKIGRAHV